MHTTLCFRGIATVAALLLAFSSAAAPVDTMRAERVARHFWNSQRDKDISALTKAMRCRPARWDTFYIFESDEATGFVIVAADDAVQPVLGYSFRNAVMADAVNRELAWWLDGYQRQIDVCRSVGAKPTAAVSNDWQRWEQDSVNVPYKGVSQLLTTKWDQGYPYNLMCPTTTNGLSARAVTGCVATAMAQVMRYWNHPVRGTGSHGYNPVYFGGASQFGYQYVDFSSTEYDWDNMPSQVSSASTSEERMAVATLMYHCGVAVDMQYGTSSQGGSGAYVHNIPYLSNSHTLNGMVNFFGYSSNATALLRKYYSDGEWQEIVRVELRAHRPVIYAGGDSEGGHCFVCDGFGGLGYFHFNWGWGGMGDGDFTLNNLAPGTGGIGGGNYSFNDDQEIIVGLQPHGEEDSLCVIRQFPYEQDFETAPTCWSAESNRMGTTWQVSDDADGVDGNYSVYVVAPFDGGSDDHLYSPYICTPGRYRITWQARSLNGSGVEHYTVSAGAELLADTLLGDVWTSREATFDVATDDTVRLDFHYTFASHSSGLMMDHIAIDRTGDAGIAGSPLSHLCRVMPNPTSGRLHIDSAEPVQRFEVLDICGRRQMVGVGPDVDLGALPTGLYMLRITTPSGCDIHRVMRIQ